jgi:peptidyl-prolyl cis-trans isomerase D
MLQNFRDRIKGWIAAVIIGLLVIPFALWGVNSYVNVARETALATVNGVEITPLRFQQRYQDQLARFQQMFGAQFQAEMFDNQGMREQVLEAIVGEELIRQRAKELRLKVGDQQLAQEIRKLDYFQDGGEFSMELYRSLLTQQGMSPTQFEARVRADLVESELPRSIQRTDFVTDAELAAYVALRDQTRSVRSIAVPSERFIAEVALTDAELLAWYEKNSDRYMDPETVALDFVELTAADVGPASAPTEAELQELYTAEQDRFRSQEQRLARHILINVEGEDVAAAEAKASALLARLGKGEDFAELAAAESADPGSSGTGGSLGWVERGMLTGPFEDALFAMQPGQLQGPVRTEFGVHVIKLEEVRGEQAKPFAEVRAELELEFIRKAGEDRFLKAAEQLTDLAYASADSLEPAAAALGLKVQRQAGVTRTGGAGVATDAKVREAAFSTEVLEDQRNSAPLELGDQRVVVLRVAERRPAQVRPYESIKAQVADAARDARAAELAQALAEQLRDRVAKGEALDAVARATGLEAPRSVRLTRDSREAPGVFTQAVFAAATPKDGVPTLGIVALGDAGRVLYALDAVTPGAVAGLSAEDQQARRAEYSRRVANAELAAYLAALRARADVQVYKDRLQ